MIPLHKPDIGEREKRAVEKVLDSGWLIQGPVVEQFERDLASYIGVKEVVCVSSCTAAIQMLLSALEPHTTLRKKIITPDFSYPSVGIAIKQANFEPVFCDINLDTYCLNLKHVKSLVDRNTYGILAHAPFGYPNKYSEVKELCEHKDLVFLEDAAPAIGSKYRGRPVGSFAFASCFSFHATKLLTTGEGGAITTNNKLLAEELRVLRNHGCHLKRFWKFGFPYRMTDIQAAIGIEQLKTLDHRIRKRRKLARLYEELLAYKMPVLPVKKQPYWNVQRYVVRSKLPVGEIIKEILKRGIEVTFGTYSQSNQPIWNRKAPVYSSYASNHTLTLPLYTTMTPDVVTNVTETLISVVHKHLTV